MPSLIITQDTISIRCEQQHIEVIKRSADHPATAFKAHVPCHDIDRVIIVGRPAITLPALLQMLKLQIPVSFISGGNRWLGSLNNASMLNVERRIMQYESARNDQRRLQVAAKIIYAKIRNSRRVLQRLASIRKQTGFPEHLEAQKYLRRMAIKALSESDSLDALRGFEGMAAAVYFKRLSTFFPDSVPFTERSRRPPRDAANALLSWTYTIVQSEIDAQVRAHGLEPGIGFLHTISHSMPSLVLDLLEPLRAPLCDMLVLHLFNHRILSNDDFDLNPDDGGVYLKAESRKKFFLAYERSMARLFSLEKGGDHVDFRKIIEHQVMSAIKAFSGECDYDFFLMP